MADSVISLSRVLVEEYESQAGPSPALRAEMEKRQKALEAEHAAFEESDPDELVRRLSQALPPLPHAHRLPPLRPVLLGRRHPQRHLRPGARPGPRPPGPAQE